jgi:prolyl 4-hydroxylase
MSSKPRQTRPVLDDAAIYRMQLGAYVKNRLLATPGMFKIPAKDLDVFVLRDFLTRDECAALCDMIDADRKPSGLLANDPDPEFRTSDSCNLSPYDPLNVKVTDRVDKLVGIEPAHGETIQGQRYAVGQQFKPHHDFFHTSQPYWPAQEATGGQRTWTAMMFLNEPEAGGQTFFPKAAVKVTPRAGNLLVWNNLDEYGQPNHFSLHQGMPVEAGVKYIITKWYRERPWIGIPASNPY